MKKIVICIIMLILISFISKGQTLNDSLNASPNPFQNRTSIYFSFTTNDTINIQVYQQFGGVMTIIISLYTDTFMTSGVYNDSLRMDSYLDGTYYVRLQIGNRKAIMKPIIKTNLTGIDKLHILTQIKIYPNPTSSTLNISDEQNELQKATIEITNSIGQTIISVPFNNSLDVSNLSPGCYFLNITTDKKQVLHSKFIKE